MKTTSAEHGQNIRVSDKDLPVLKRVRGYLSPLSPY